MKEQKSMNSAVADFGCVSIRKNHVQVCEDNLMDKYCVLKRSESEFILMKVLSFQWKDQMKKIGWIAGSGWSNQEDTICTLYFTDYWYIHLEDYGVFLGYRDDSRFHNMYT